MNSPAPLEDLVVNDRFWLRYASRSIEGAAEARIATADKLVAASGWFWTVYTGVAIVGVAFASRDLSASRAIWIFLPVPLLAATYLMSVYAAAAIEGTFDPRVPSEVSEAYVRASGKRRGRIERAGAMLAVAAVSVVVAGVAAATSPPDMASAAALQVISPEECGGLGPSLK